MTVAPAGLVAGLDVLQRALDYTCAALRTVTPADLARPTPCSAWSVADLLAHMEDALDAFTEAAGGTVALRTSTPTPVAVRISALQQKASGLLVHWMATADVAIAIDRTGLPPGTVARLAALEITVHGWDVHRSLGVDVPLPEGLAGDLLATVPLTRSAPPGAFGPVVPTGRGAPAGDELLGRLGRNPTRPLGKKAAGP